MTTDTIPSWYVEAFLHLWSNKNNKLILVGINCNRADIERKYFVSWMVDITSLNWSCNNKIGADGKMIRRRIKISCITGGHKDYDFQIDKERTRVIHVK